MEFGLSKEQQLIVSSISQYLGEKGDLERVRQFTDGGDARAEDLRMGLRDLDVSGLIIDEKFGGVGLKFIDAALVAETLGVDAGEMIKKVARLHCQGTLEAAKSRGSYTGIPTCYASHLVGGNKQCAYGCLGYGDCVKACQFDALYMDNNGLPVVIAEKCMACGKCVDACPRNLFALHPLSQEILVFCRSEDRGPMARKLCKAACIACGICARACPDAIVMEKNLAVITDFRKIDPEKIPDIEKCPTDSIGRIHLEGVHDEG